MIEFLPIFGAMLNSDTDGFFLMDSHSQVLYANPTAKALFGKCEGCSLLDYIAAGQPNPHDKDMTPEAGKPMPIARDGVVTAITLDGPKEVFVYKRFGFEHRGHTYLAGYITDNIPTRFQK